MFGLSPSMQGFLGGAAAVSFPLLFNLIKDICLEHRKRKEERNHISVQLIFLLDKFVGDCAKVAWDRGFDETFQPPESPEYLKEQVKTPVFDMSKVKGEYKYLKPIFLYRLQSIDIELLKADEELREFTNNPNFGPEYLDDYFLKRRELYIEIGLKVSELADEIRKVLKVKLDHGWNPKESLLDSKASIYRIKSKRMLNRMRRKAERKMKSKDIPPPF